MFQRVFTTLSSMPVCGKRFFGTMWASTILAHNFSGSPDSARMVMMASTTVVRFKWSERELHCKVYKGVVGAALARDTATNQAYSNVR